MYNVYLFEREKNRFIIQFTFTLQILNKCYIVIIMLKI